MEGNRLGMRRKLATVFCLFAAAVHSARGGPAIGIAPNEEEFHEWVSSGRYVDQTLMIEEYFGDRNGANNKIMQITRPSGWGKTVNLKMLKAFLEIEINKTTGTVLPETERVNGKLFFGGEIRTPDGRSKRLNALNIAANERLVAKHFGQHPVLYVSFKSAIGTNYNEVWTNIKEVITELYRQHRYLQNGIDADVEGDFELYCRGNVNGAGMKHSLEFLSGLLRKRFGRKVYIFVDDFDTPISYLFFDTVRRLKRQSPGMLNWEAFIKASETKEYRQVLWFVQSVLTNALRNEDTLERAVISGVLFVPALLPIPGTELNVSSQQAQNLTTGAAGNHFGLLNEAFSTFYGFDKNRTYELLNRTALKIDRFSRLVQWYGYNFTVIDDGNVTDRNVVRFPPRSIQHFIANDGKFDCYHKLCGGNTDARSADMESLLVSQLLGSDEMQVKIGQLIDGYTVFGVVDREAGFDQAGDRMTVLLFAGYLNAMEQITNIWKLSIPNREMADVYRRELAEWICGKLEMTPEDFFAMAVKLVQFRVEQFKTLLTKRVEFIGDHLLDSAEKATVYFNGIVQVLLYCLEVDYDVHRYRHSHIVPKKPDIVLIARADSRWQNAILFEFEITDDCSFLAKRTRAAMKEIHQKSKNIYLAKYEHVKFVLKLCLIFCRNKLAMDYFIEKNDQSAAD